jgi:hypothetical protein
MFGKKKAVHETNPNAVEFSKAFGRADKVTTTVTVGETALTVERVRKVWFFKCKPKIDTVDYQSIEKVESKTFFSKSYLFTSIFFGVAAIIAAFFVVFGEDVSAISLLGWLIAFAGLLFCAYGKRILITRKDSSTVSILVEGGVQNEEIQLFTQKLGEKDIAVQGLKSS